MKRILTWYLPEMTGVGTRQGPTYYLDGDYELSSLRVYARIAPAGSDLTFNIKVDDVSIMASNARLPVGANTDEMLEDWTKSTPLEEGSWVSLDITDNGNAKEITVQLELLSLSDSD